MNVDPIRRFINRTKAANQSGAKEVKMPLSEALELNTELALLIIEATSGQNKQEEKEKTFDGGSLKTGNANNIHSDWPTRVG